MPKIQTSPIGSNLFRLDGLDYGKNQYQIVYNNVEIATNGTVDESVISVGIFNRQFQTYLVRPTPVNTWINSGDVPYANLTALITALDTIVGFETGGGGGGGVPNLQAVTNEGNVTTQNMLVRDLLPRELEQVQLKLLLLEIMMLPVIIIVLL